MNFPSGAVKARITLFSGAIILFLLGISCTRKGKKVVDRYRDGNVFAVCVYPDTEDTTTFELLNYYPDGKIFKEGEIKNDEYVGNKVSYYESGKISQIDSLFYPQARHDPKWNGILTRYNQNGTLSQQFFVKNGLFNGPCYQYGSNGVLIKEYNLIEDSVKDGLYEEFYDNGKVSLKFNYTKNVLNGIAYFFDTTGDTIKYYYFKNNLLSYPYKRWLKDGQTIIGEFEDSVRKRVVWKWYDKNGEVLKQQKGFGIKEGYYIP